MLHKDPERPGVRRLRRRTCTRCSLIICVLTALSLFFLARPVLSGLRVLKSSRFFELPPREYFVNETNINRVANRGDVVQPLVGLNDTFDIAVTVWQATTTLEQTEQYLARQKLKQNESELGFIIEYNETTAEGVEESGVHRWYLGDLDEKAIFSDIVFRGLRLSDSDVHTNVTFQMPTEVFRQHVRDSALRASFVLIPHSPSPIDNFKNFTSWLPAGMRRPPFKSLPF
ncbi:hypothetical protein C8J57DRAFT_435001 [Mycena rebaudengoi]|nr:hypothetical protein C8J57DRAFT_435001 [Mycena rebaudengoi]